MTAMGGADMWHLLIAYGRRQISGSLRNIICVTQGVHSWIERFFIFDYKQVLRHYIVSVGLLYPHNIMPSHLRKFRELNALIRQRNLKKESEPRPSSASAHDQQPAISNEQLGEDNQDASSGEFDDRGED